MATDLKTIIANLLGFYDFRDKTIIDVGIGGGQMAEYSRDCKKVYAIDNDESAIQKLKEHLVKAGLEGKFDVINDDFYNLKIKGDLVLFEFCLHEMADPIKALRSAKKLARDIVIIDHLPGLEWSYYTVETEKIALSWQAIRKFPIKKEARYVATQYFKDYDELYEKLRSLGDECLRRIENFKNKKDFSIPMPYALAQI